MRNILRFTPMLMLSGCAGEWVTPWQGAKLIQINMMGVRISWPVIAVPAVIALVVVTLKLRATLRNSK